MNNLVDATGKEIVLGQRYGYSRAQNGFSHTTIGTAIGVAKDKVRLGGCKVKHFLYGEPTSFGNCASDVSIRANMVFPVYEDVNVEAS